MVDKRLIDYVHKTLSSGYSAAQVREALLKKGWKQEDVDEAMLAVSPMVSAKPRPLKKVSKKIPQQESRKMPKKPVRDFFSSFKKPVSKKTGISVSPEEKVVASSNEPKKQENILKEQKEPKEQEKPVPEETKKDYTQDLVKGISQKSMFETKSFDKSEPINETTDKKNNKKNKEKDKDLSEEDVFKEFDFDDNEEESSDDEKDDKTRKKEFSGNKAQQKQSDKGESLRGLKITLTILIILFLAVLGAGIWYFFFYSGPPFF